MVVVHDSQNTRVNGHGSWIQEIKRRCFERVYNAKFEGDEMVRRDNNSTVCGFVGVW
jgi:hypothetical protein